MHDPLIQIFDRLGSLDAKVELLLETSRKSSTNSEEISTRVTSLEHTRTHHKGVIAALSAVCGVIGGAIGHFVK